ncbi:MAG: hypothetical protein E7062_07845 [Spirochaetaceae bacterium]|nr:hypothetical protein [Spirochaetaceae bacterium]
MANFKSNTEESFFQRIFGSLFGGKNPEAEKKRLLRSIAKNLSKTKYKFYKASSGEITAEFAKFFYEIYKTISSAQLLIQNVKNENHFKTFTIDTSLSKKQQEITERLTEEAILLRSKTTDIDELTNQIRNDLLAFSAEFDAKKIDQVDSLYVKFLSFKNFVCFDYYFMLKKFDSHLQERDFNYIPRFETIRAEYVLDDIIEFINAAWNLSFGQSYADVFAIVKAIKGIDPINQQNWQKISNKIRNLKESRCLEMITQLISKNPDLRQNPKVSSESIIQPMIDKMRNDAEKVLQKIEQERKNNKVGEYLNHIFGTTNVVRLKNYSESGSHPFERKKVGSFVYHQPLNYLKAFLNDYLKKDIREMADLILVRGKWSTAALANQMSDVYHTLLDIANQITEFDETLAEDKDFGMKTKTMLVKVDRDRDAARILQSIINDANEQAHMLLTSGSQNLILFAKNLKMLLEDKEKQSPDMIINWKELEHFADWPIKQKGIEIYKQIHALITLIKCFIK